MFTRMYVVLCILPDVTYLPDNMVSPIIILRLGHVKYLNLNVREATLKHCKSNKAMIIYIIIIICGAKLLSSDWLRKRAFFLNHGGTFGNQVSMIT